MRRIRFTVLTFLLLLGGRAYAVAPVVIQHNQNTAASSSTVSKAFSSSLTAGSYLYVACSEFTQLQSVGVSDSQGNGFFRVYQDDNNANLENTGFITTNPVSAGGDTVTCSTTGAANFSIIIMEISGINGVDVSAGTIPPVPPPTPHGNKCLSCLSVQPGSITNIVLDEIFVTQVYDSHSSHSFSINSGYTIIETTAEPGGQTLCVAYLIVSSSGATNPTWTPGVSANMFAGNTGLAIIPARVRSHSSIL